MKLKVDLFSDTGTRPTRKMREFMAEAPVGDEQLKEDPSVNKLREMAADILGKEDAIYLPSGIMANQISYAVFCQPGDEIIMDETAHPIHFEAGGTAVISGASINPVAGERGIFSAEQAAEKIRVKGHGQPRSRMFSVEQSTNLGGGTVWPLSTIKELYELARDNDMKLHIDGARLLNAATAASVAPSEYGRYCDSIWLDLSKGLGAPLGSVLAGNQEFIEEARTWKKRLGGAMRQAGITAAGGIYALRHHRERLKEDHHLAILLAKGINEIEGLNIELNNVETNIVLFTIEDHPASQLVDKMQEKGVRIGALGENLLRAVTHLHIKEKDIEYTLKVMKEAMNSL